VVETFHNRHRLEEPKVDGGGSRGSFYMV